MKRNKTILTIIIILLFIGSISFVCWQKKINLGNKFVVPAEEKKEISQEEAINLVLEKYPGEIKSIVRSKIILERNIPSPDFWLIEIALEEPMFFEKINKEIKTIKVKITMDKNIDIYELVE